MTAAEASARRALQVYYRASGVNLPYEDLEAILVSRSPRFLQLFGSSIQYSELTETQVNEAMTKLAVANYGKWPAPNETGGFFDALINKIFSFSNKVSLVTDAVKATADDVVSAAKVGASAYAIVGAIGFLLVVLSFRKGK